MIKDFKNMKNRRQPHGRMTKGSKNINITIRKMNSSAKNRKSSSRKHSSTTSTRLLRKRKTKKRLSVKAFLGKVFLIFFGLGMFLGALAFISLGVYLKQIEKSLPSPDQLLEHKSDQSTIIYDRNGVELYVIHGSQNREFVPLSEIPDHTKWAFLAAEDIDFYNHKGLDVPGLIRAVYADGMYYLFHKGHKQGASTISEQLVKRTLIRDILGDEADKRTVAVKLKEMLITMQIEKTFSKDEILQMYLNEVPLGGVNYGVQAASKFYFGKDVKDLDLAESAMLAGIVQAPGAYSPLVGSDPEMAKVRQEYVLDQMLKYKDYTGVTEEDVEKAKKEKLKYASVNIDIKAPHFVFYVKEELEKEFGIDKVERGGLKVFTTLDYSVQQIVQKEVTDGIKKYGQTWAIANGGVHNGAAVVIDPRTNQIIAMVGSVDYFKDDDPRIDGKVNVTTSLRQMGSSVKPYTYLTAFHEGYGPWLETPDVAEFRFGNYDPPNWDGKNWGYMLAQKALPQSRNVPAVYTLQLAGIVPVMETMQKVGITTLKDPSQYGLSLTLGTAEMKLLEHAGGYTVFANGGVKKPIVSILKVEDSHGQVLKEFKESKGKRVFSEQEVYALNWVLCDLGSIKNRNMFAHYYHINGVPICGKTGTTNGPRDLVALLYHKNLVVAVWAGNNNNVETPGAWSTTVPLPIAHNIVQKLSSKYKPQTPTRPSGIYSVVVCEDTGHAATADNPCKKVPSIYIAGHAPIPDEREVLEVCKDSGKKSTNLEQSKKFDLLKKVFFLKNYKLENSFQDEAYKKYLSKLGSKSDKKNVIGYVFEEPEEGACELPLGPDDSPVVSITSPSDGVEVKQNSSITVSFDYRVKENLKKASLLLDGTEIYSTTDVDNLTSLTTTIDNSVTVGEHTLTVKLVDNYDKYGTDSIKINVKEEDVPITITISSPSQNEVINSFPVVLSAQIEHGDVDKVVYKIDGPSGYHKVYTATNDQNFIINWENDDNSVVDGDYTISSVGIKGTEIINGNSINVTVSLSGSGSGGSGSGSP